MRNRVFIIHGWGGKPDSEWFPWAKMQIEKLNFDVIVPEMPDTQHPKIDIWLGKLKEVVEEVKTNDIFIGHSIGCQTILRYINSFTKNQKVGKLILVAPWWYLNLSTNDEKLIAKSWLEVNVDFDKIKSNTKKIICVFSDDDPVVPLDINVKFFKEKMNSEIIIERKKRHFSGDDGIFEIPSLLPLLK